MVDRFGIQMTRAVAAVIVAGLAVAACGAGADGPASGMTGSETAMTTQPTPRTSTPAGAPVTSTPSADAASMVDVAAIEAAVYADIAGQFADAPPGSNPHPGKLECGSGSVAVGSALACSYLPDEPLEFGGVFVIVLDAERIVWTSAPCCDGGPWPEDYPAGVFCRDLAAPPPDAPGESPEYHLSYGLAVWYWYAEGRPDRMDADLDGIPCETVYDSDEIAAFWDSAIPLG